jgi:hypothetical protein
VHEAFQSRQECFRLTDGRYVNWRQAHHRDASGSMVLVPGATAVEMTADQARGHHLGFATLDEAADAFGAKREGDRFFIVDNLNSHWDGWVIGGRWGSLLKLLPGRQGYTAMPLEFLPEFAWMFNKPQPAAWQPTPGYCDQARKMDIDWAGMQAEAGVNAGAEWDLVNSWTKGERWSTSEKLRGKFTADDAGRRYRSQSAIQAIREGQQKLPPGERPGLSDEWLHTREQFVAAAAERAGIPYAMVFRGEWLESRGEGVTDWNKQFRAILDQVADEAMITMLDCHV